MPSVEMTDSGPPLTEEALATLESKLQARLPAPYRRFLCKHNGGRPEPSYFQRFTLHTFYSVGAGAKLNDLLANQRRMRKWLPEEVIPIADDDFGNEICLAIRGKNRGKVYFWDHEGAPEIDDLEALYPGLILNPPDEEDERSNVTTWPGHPDLSLIADSFAKFLDSFHDFDDEEAQAKPKSAKSKSKPSKAKPATKQPGKKPRKSPKA
jgi:hypothetical protein